MGEALQEGTGQRWRDGPKIYSVPTMKYAGSVFGVEKKIQEPTFIFTIRLLQSKIQVTELLKSL